MGVMKQVSELVDEPVTNIHPEAHSLGKATDIRDHREIIFHTKSHDKGKSTADHLIAWTADPYLKGMSVEEKESVKLGEILAIYAIRVAGQHRLFLKVQPFDIERYDFGGIWAGKVNPQLRTTMISSHQASEPVIHNRESDNVIAFLNPKINVRPLDEKVLYDHVKRK